MEAITILLLIIILVILITFRNYVTDYFKKIESDIQQLKEIPRAAINEPTKAVTKEVIENKPKKAAEDYWQSSFKRVDEPPTVPLEKEIVLGEKINIEPVQVEKKTAYPISEKIDKPPQYIPAPKLSFYERNPDLEKFIGENLVSKIGIAILVLAIGFFVKFAIDNNWIGPVGRVGIGLLCEAF